MLDVRPITPDELDAFCATFLTTFGSDAADAPEVTARLRATIAPLRAWAAFDGPTLAATAASYTMTVGVPGSTMAMAGLAFVTVRPTHRRRGLLRALIGHHLDDARARGEAISGMWPSEGTIYGRFGYAVAVHSYVVTLDSRAGTLAMPGEPDPTVWLEPDAARLRLPPIYARHAATRPGATARDAGWWEHRTLSETASNRDGASLLRHVVVCRDGADVGYVLYRQRPGMSDGLPAGTVEIIELVALDSRAEASLWRFVAGIDLFPTARWDNAPLDTVLPWIASEPRRIQRSTFDTMWLRIDDVAAALAGRRYAVDGALRFAIDGRGVAPAGSAAEGQRGSIGEASWELTVEAGRGRCVRTDAAPELRFADGALASVFLGGIPVGGLARAGKITGGDAAIARADRMFAWPVAPWCVELF